MKKYLLFFIVCLSVGFNASALTYEQMTSDFNELVTEIANEYGPLKHKEALYNFTLSDLAGEYEAMIQPEMSEDDFYYLIVKFVANFQDVHFGITNDSAESANLGFEVELTEGAYIVTSIDHSILPKGSVRFDVGDELIEFDGQNVDSYIKKTIFPYIRFANKKTQNSFGALLLTNRRKRLSPLPTGTVKIMFASRIDKSLRREVLSWNRVTPQKTQLQIELPQINTMIGSQHRCSDVSRIAIPENASILDVPFTAYSMPTEKGDVGFIRIPHYAPFNYETGEIDAEKWLIDYEKALTELEARTVGLIIDQDFNCGGSVALVHKMVSYFADKPFDPALFTFRAGPKQLQILNWHFDKYYTEGTTPFRHFQFVIAEVTKAVLAGDYATPKIPLWGFYDYAVDDLGEEQVQPSSVRYTKPVLLLTNEMSASGGDMFPGFMKDLGFAKIMGQQTAGAGGHIYVMPEDPFMLTHSKVRAIITRSLFYTPNGDVIEDNGIEPHYYYDITLEDHLGGYQEYLNKAVEHLFKDL